MYKAWICTHSQFSRWLIGLFWWRFVKSKPLEQRTNVAGLCDVVQLDIVFDIIFVGHAKSYITETSASGRVSARGVFGNGRRAQESFHFVLSLGAEIFEDRKGAARMPADYEAMNRLVAILSVIIFRVSVFGCP